MWCSAGYALFALVAGFLFSIDPHLNFWTGSVMGVQAVKRMKQFFHRPQGQVMRNLHGLIHSRRHRRKARIPVTHVGVCAAALQAQNQGVVS